jgi:hypothetical protein
MLRSAKYTAITILLAGAAAHAQMSDQANFQGASWEGIHIYGVNAYTSYVSSVYPVFTTVNLPANNFGANLNYGVSTSLGAQFRRGEKFHLSLFGTGSYNRSQNYNNLSAFGGSLIASLSYEVTQKFTVSISATGLYETVADYIFAPSGLSVAAQSPNSVYDLASGMGVGQFGTSPTQTTPITTVASAPTPSSSPATALLFGSNILSYAAQAIASYQATSRLSFSFGGVSAGGENRFGGNSAIPEQTQTLPRTIGLLGSASIDYALSPRTTMGLVISGARNSNIDQHAYTTSAQVSFGRMMGAHWFMGGAGGYAYSVSVAQQSGSPKSQQWIGSGSLGYRLSSQSFGASYNRTTMEANGFAIGTNTSVRMGWSWHPRGSRWAVIASGGEQKMDNTGFSSLSGWYGSGGWRMRLPANLSLSAQYSYSKSNGIFFGDVLKVSVNSIRISIGWVPAALEAALEAAAQR